MAMNNEEALKHNRLLWYRHAADEKLNTQTRHYYLGKAHHCEELLGAEGIKLEKIGRMIMNNDKLSEGT